MNANESFLIDAASSGNVWQGFSTNGPISFLYNGVSVTYVPKTFVEKGYVSGVPEYQYPQSGGYTQSLGTSKWFGNLAFLNQDIYQYLKPATLSQDFIDKQSARTYFADPGKVTNSFDLRNVENFADGYIIHTSVFNDFATQAGFQTFSGSPGGLVVDNPPRVPTGIGTGPDGNLSYIGYTADTSGSNQRYDLFYINQATPTGYYDFKWSSSIFNAYPALRFLDIAARIVNPFYNLGRAVGDYAFNDGKIGDVALAVIGVNTPNAQGVTAAQNTIFEIPQIANAASTVSEFYQANLGLNAAQATTAAKVTIDTALGYLANGQDFSAALAGAAASYVGSEAGKVVAAQVAPLGTDVQKITQATTSAATRATLLNQDVGIAVTNAFAQTAIPMAVDGALKAAGITTVSAENKKIISDAAIATAAGGDIASALQSAVTGVIVKGAADVAKAELVKQGVISESDTAAVDKIAKFVSAYMSGADPSKYLANEMIAQIAKSAEQNLKQLGVNQTDEQIAASAQQERVNNDLRSFVTAMDPTFNEAEYRRLNNIPAGVNAFEHWLDQGQFQGLATNAEQYVNRALSAIPEYDAAFYTEEYTAALNAARAGDLAGVDKAVAAVDRSWTTEEEANALFQSLFGRLPQNQTEQAFVSHGVGRSEDETLAALQKVASARASSDAQRAQSIQSYQRQIENALTSEGYTDQDISAMYQSGDMDRYVQEVISAQDANIKQLQMQAGVAEIMHGSDSQQYKDAFKDLVQAQYEAGGYGVTKDGENYVVAGQLGSYENPIAHPGLIVSSDGSVTDLSGGRPLVDIGVTLPGQETQWFPDETEQDISALYATGQSPNPPEQGGKSIFGDGSGTSGGVVPGFTFVGIDKKTGGMLYDSDSSGFGLIMYSDGRAVAVNKENPVEWFVLDPELANSLISTPKQKPVDVVSAAIGNIQQAADEKVLTETEVRSLLASNGMSNPTPEQVSQFVGKTATPEQAKQAVVEFANQNSVTQEEARQALLDIGVTNPSQSDVDRLVGQYLQTDLAQKAQTIKTEAQLRSDLEQQIGGVQTQIGSVQAALSQAIADAKAAGLDGDAALQVAIDAVATDLGTTKEALLSQLGTTEAALRADMEAGLSGVAASVADTKTALEAAIADAKAAGLEGDAALKAAIDAVAADQQTSSAELLAKLGTTETQLRSDLASQIGGVQTQIGNVESALSKAIADAEAAGLSRDQAIQAALEQVSTELGTTQQNLLDQLGTTEQALLDRISGLQSDAQAQYDALTAEQKALADALTAQGLSLADAISAAQSQSQQQIADLESKLTDAIAAAEDAGLTRDQAIQAAVDSVASDLGITRESLLAQIGATEATLRSDIEAGLAGVSADIQAKYDALTAEQKVLADSLAAQGTSLAEAIAAAQKQTQEQIGGVQADVKAKYDALTAEQKALADALAAQGTSLSDAIAEAQKQTQQQIGDTEARLNEAIAAAEAAGLTRDQAIQAALDSVAADLGIARSDLLTQLGTTEEALRSEFQTGLQGVSAEVKASYNALSAEQKALADALAAQGLSLSEAIASAKSQTEQQIGDVETRLSEAIAAAESAGLTRDQAIQSAVDAVAADLGITRSDLLTRIGSSEATLRADLEAGLAGLGSSLEAAYNALTAEQKVLADALSKQGLDLSEAINLAKSSLESQIGGVSAEMQKQYDALSQGQKDIVDQMIQQGADFQTALDVAVTGLQGQMQSQYDSLTSGQKQLADQLIQQGLDLSDAIMVAKSDLQAQIEQTAQILGKPAQQVTQGDIDLVTQMIGQQNQNLAYDVNQDGTINQADVDILTGRLTNVDEPWNAPAGTKWAPTGLYAENAALRQQQQQQYQQLMDELAANEAARQAQAEAAKQEAAKQAAAQRKLAIQGQIRSGLQNVIQQMPVAIQQAQGTIKPIYGGETEYVDINAPLQVGGIFDTWSTIPNKRPQTKMATGGYLDMQGEPETWDDILRMLNQ